MSDEITEIQNQLATALSTQFDFLVQPTIPTALQANTAYLMPPTDGPMFDTRTSPASFAKPTIRHDLVLIGSETDRPHAQRWLQGYIVPIALFLRNDCPKINGHKAPTVNNVRLGLIGDRFPAVTFELTPISMECT